MTTTKKVVISILTVAAIAVAYWLLSPLFYDVEVNDPNPTRTTQNATATPSGVGQLSQEEQQKMEEMMKDVEEDKSMNESQPTENMPQERFQVEGTDGHPAEGYVRIIPDTSDGAIIRYEDFESTNGPQLHLYLAKSLEADDIVDLGPVKGTKGNINYSVPSDVDISEYNYVMYWCKPFGVLFNYADISSFRGL